MMQLSLFGKQWQNSAEEEAKKESHKKGQSLD